METKSEKSVVFTNATEVDLYLREHLNPDQVAIEGLDKILVIRLKEPPEDGWEQVEI